MSAEQSYYAVIPADVRYDKDLRPNAKLLYAELTSLSNKHGYCWATNEYFAELFGLSAATVSRLISQLAAKGYIRCEMAATDKGSERRIYAGSFVVQKGLDKNVNTPVDENVKEGLDENVNQNNKQEEVNSDISPLNPPEGDKPAGDVNKPKRRSKKQSAGPYKPDWFEAFWKVYPRKDGKQRARDAWNKLRPDEETCNAMREGLNRAKKSRQWTKDNGEFIPHAATWINGRMWQDEGVDLSCISLLQSDAASKRTWADDPEVTS